jgi:tetratricopeptide (TPR) repeat protein/DNA-binding winged helix-turn-helix (wHTH) protein
MNMRVGEKRGYRFGEIELDVSLGCLKLNGQERYLRQKAFHLLLYMLEHRDRLVTKDELIENIWEGTAVTDSALVQVIKEVRRSLNDDPHQPQFIKTIPKAGYRFIARVEETIPERPAVIEIKEITTIAVEYEEENATPVRPAEIDARLLPVRTQKSARNRRLLLAAASLVVLVAAVAVVYHQSTKSPLPDITLTRVEGRKTVAVMRFEDLSASADMDWLREGLADMLITDLSRSTKLTVLGRQQLHILLERLGKENERNIQLYDAFSIARASRADVVVLGSYASVGGTIQISVQLYDTLNNQALASERVVVDKPKEIIAQADLLSLKVAAHLGAGPKGQEMKQGLTEAMTNNLEAYRCYSLAVEKTYARQNAEAIALLEKAVSLDPQFAMAYARIGFAYAVNWSFGEKAKPYLETAFRLADRLTDKDRLYITAWYSISNDDFAGAIRTCQEIVARYPLEVEAYWRLAGLLEGEERFDEALDAGKRGLAIDPEAKELCNQMGAIYLDLRRFEESTDMYRRYVALAPDEPNAYDSLGLILQAVGRYDEATESYQRALALKPDFDVALVHLANIRFQQGRYREATNRYQRYIQIAPSETERRRGYGALCWVYLRKGEVERAEEAARQEKKSGNEFSGRALLIALHRGEETKVTRLQEQLFASTASLNRGRRETRRFENYFRGCLELKRGRAEEAIEQFKEALRHRPPYWDMDTLEDCLANAYLALGRPDEAIAEYERVLSLNPNYPLAHHHLAEAYERKGDNERARTEYERFLKSWKDADQDIPEIKTAIIKCAMPDRR